MTWGPLYGYMGETSRKLRLGAGESGELIFWGNMNGVLEPIKGKHLKLELVLENRFGERYCETMELIAIVNSDDTGNLPKIHLEAQNYRIGKYIKRSNGKIDIEWEDTSNGQP